MTVRRDRWGRYLVIGEDGQERPYTRATTIAGTLDDKQALIPWKAAMTVTGMLRRPGLRARWEALCSAHPQTGPWYGDTDSKREAKDLVEECSAAGGALDRAEIGTALHELTHHLDLGDDVTISDPNTRADLNAYQAKIAELGITYDPAGIEAVIVVDWAEIAGTADRLITYVPGRDLPVVADLKTGADLHFSWGSIAQQLALYSRAQAIYNDGTRIAVPQLDLERALVIHLPAGEARCDVWWVNIAAGWDIVLTALKVREWRADSRNGGLKLEPLEAPTGPQRPPSIRDDLQRRIDRIRAHNAGMDVLRRLWPPGLPTLKQANDHTTEQLAQIDRALVVVEAELQLPLEPPTPSTKTQGET